MRLLRSVLLALVVLALCAGAASAKGAAKKGARVDASFGKGGTLAVSVPKADSESPVEIATAPSGKSYVLDGSLLLAFGADGHPDRGFGTNGRIEVAAAGGVTTEVADLTVDADGRVLVAGSFEPTPGAVDNIIPAEAGNALPKPAVSEPFVIRYQPSGARDVTFGSDGQVDLALTPPPLPAGDPRYEVPTVTGEKVAVVEGEHVVLGGSYTYDASSCYFASVPARAFVARVEPEGSGQDTIPTGAYTNLERSRVSALTPTPEGGLAALSSEGLGCPNRGTPLASTVSLLNAAAQPVAGLDPARPTLLNTGDGLAVDGRQRLLLLETPEFFDFHGDSPPWKLERLLPDGDFDPAFGENGGLPLSGFGEESVRGLVVERQDRIIVGGGSHKFRLLRVGTRGKIDRSFGRHGWIEVDFGPDTSAELGALTIDAKGRVVAAGHIDDPALKSGVGIAVARFLPNG